MRRCMGIEPYSKTNMNSIFLYIYCRPLIEIILAIPIIVISWTILACVLYKIKKHKSFESLNMMLLVIFLFSIVYSTIASRTQEVTRPQLIPFYSFIEAKVQPEIYRSMLMNVFLFVPLGLTMPYALPNTVKHKVKTTVLAACALSATIELVQLLFHLGRCETDDVICNTLGAAIGTLSYCIYIRIDKKSS